MVDNDDLRRTAQEAWEFRPMATEPTTSQASAIAEAVKWKEVARQAGVCMACAVNQYEPCTDCLGTGWDGGSPQGYVSEAFNANAIAEAVKAERSEILRANPMTAGDLGLLLGEMTAGELRTAKALLWHITETIRARNTL